jgi:hypothetical protein
VPARRLAEHDERIAAHWDGLAVDPGAAAACAADRLGAEDPWERASAACAWLAFGQPSPEDLVRRWAETPPEHAPSWREGLRGLEAERVEALLPAHDAARLTPLALALMVDALGWHGRLGAPWRSAAVRHPDAAVRAALARALGHAGEGGEAGGALTALLEDADAAVRRRAMWSTALLDREAARARARSLASGAAPDPFALRLLGLLGEPEDLGRLTAAAATEAGRPAAFHALADLGTAEAVEALLRLLTLPDESLRLAVTEALDGALGGIPRADVEIPARPEEGRAHWGLVRERLREDARVLGGLDARWRGAPEDVPGAWLWRSAVTRSRGDAAWRREVPDGFFDDRPAPDARAGE